METTDILADAAQLPLFDYLTRCFFGPCEQAPAGPVPGVCAQDGTAWVGGLHGFNWGDGAAEEPTASYAHDEAFSPPRHVRGTVIMLGGQDRTALMHVLSCGAVPLSAAAALAARDGAHGQDPSGRAGPPRPYWMWVRAASPRGSEGDGLHEDSYHSPFDGPGQDGVPSYDAVLPMVRRRGRVGWPGPRCTIHTADPTLRLVECLPVREQHLRVRLQTERRCEGRLPAGRAAHAGLLWLRSSHASPDRGPVSAACFLGQYPLRVASAPCCACHSTVRRDSSIRPSLCPPFSHRASTALSHN